MASRSLWGRRAAATSTRGERLASARHASIVGALRAHEHRTAALLLGLVTLAYLWPALIEGHVLSPVALLYAEAPWATSAPAGISRWINGDLGDVPLSYYPWDVLARRMIHAGTFPAWNPYAFGGTPLLANGQIAWLSPFSLPLWILPLDYGLGVAAALKLWAAGFGTYLLARELRLGFWPGMVAGVAFALCSYDVVWLTFGVFVSVAAMLPWALWLVERVLRRGRSVDGLALAGVLLVALLGGHPGTQVHVLAATALYAAIRAATIRDEDGRERLRRLALVGGGIAVALLTAMVVLLPAERASIDTVGAAARAHGAPGFPGSRMPFGVVRTALFPDWWGRPSEGVFLGPGPAGYRERTFYAGAATLVLALVALLSPGGWRRKAPFAVIGALGLAIALRLPGLYEAVIRLPGFDRVQNSRIYVWFLLATAVLAGFGLQRIADARGRLGRAWLAPAAALLAAVVAVVAIAPAGGSWAAALRHLVDRSGRAADALALASVLRWLAFAALLTALVLVVRRAPRLRTPALVLVTLLIALDLLQFAAGYNPIGPAATVVPPRTAAIAFLQRHRDDGRIAGIQAAGADYTSVFGLRDVRGYDAPLPSERFFGLWRLMDPAADPYGLTRFTELTPRILGMLGARWLLLPPGAQLPGPEVRAVYQGRDASVYENRLAAPRAYVARSVRLVSGRDEELATIAEDSFDPRREATVRTSEVAGAPLVGDSRGTARVQAERNSSVTLRTSTDRRSLIVLGDTWAPGWSVEVDGRAARPVQANAVLRAVAVPAGQHEVVWSYRVPGLRLGAALSALGLALAAAWGGVLVVRSWRRARR